MAFNSHVKWKDRKPSFGKIGYRRLFLRLVDAALHVQGVLVYGNAVQEMCDTSAIS